MSKQVVPGPIVNGGNCIKEAVCIHTDKVYDSCRDKECLEDLRVYLTVGDQEIVDNATSVKLQKAEIIRVYTDVEPVPFNQGYYTVDIRFFFKVTLDVFREIGRPKRVEGLSVYDKKVVLFGSEGKAKIFRSVYQYDSNDYQAMSKTNLPNAVVEVVDPIALGAKIVDQCPKHCCDCFDISSVPEGICNCFEDIFSDPDSDRQVFISLGLFSITKLERNVQLLIPVYDFCIPQDECVSASPSNPCELFEQITFPVDEFYPPQKHDFVPCSGNSSIG